MSLDLWLRQLRETGCVRVQPPSQEEEIGAENPSVIAIIKELDASVRLDAPFEPPALEISSTIWAAVLLYQASQCFVYRFVPSDAVRAMLSRPCPELPTPRVCYSVDLILRYLPDIISLARGLAEDDPLVEGLAVVARAWPLSSVGIKGISEVDVSAFIDHPSLRRTYADRIIDRADVSRLGDRRALEAVREALGGFPELAPVIAAALQV